MNGGTYTVQLTVADNFGCQDSVTQMLSVANTPLMASNLPNLQVQCLSAVPLPDPSQVTAAGTGNVVLAIFPMFLITTVAPKPLCEPIK